LVFVAACDGVLGLTHIPDPPPIVPPGVTTLAAGSHHACSIRKDGALYCWGGNESGQLGIGAGVLEPDVVEHVGDATWTAVTAHANLTCGIQSDGSLWCWGDNFRGALGTGDTMDLDAPGQIAGYWRAVSTNFTHTCAVETAGDVWCWGLNQYGALGDGTTTDHPSPVLVDSGYLTVAVGATHTCAIRSNHSLACWGRNEHGQLGDGTTQDQLVPETIAGESWSQIASGRYHTCGITTGGQLRCWGGGGNGALGNGGLANEMSPSPVLIAGLDTTGWIGVTANERHTCAWTASSASCWGDSSRGELGADTNAIDPLPVAFPGGPYRALAAGEHHVCAADADGAVSCMGANGWGQLGVAGSGQLAPELVDAGPWSDVTAGDTNTCAISAGPGAHSTCGGENYDGELGTGTRKSLQVLAPLDTMRWQQLSAGLGFVCGIGDSSQPLCWGTNADGELGAPAGAMATTPQRPNVPSGTFNDIAANDHACAKDSGNQLYCWGNNTPPTMIPPVAPNSDWNDVAVGTGFTCAIGNVNLLVYCWGANDAGQLGIGSTVPQAAPTKVAGSTQFSKIFAGARHACAISSGAAAYCWGDNHSGQLGIAGVQMQTTPTLIAGTWKRMALGTLHSCGLRSDLQIACWGANTRGQVGNGDTARATVTTPLVVAVPGVASWTALATGTQHTCAVAAPTGPLYCWGSNDDGALVDGNAWSATPVPVPLP
jgi:alpha-tubulin suppressor-like RCC1 family protein